MQSSLYSDEAEFLEACNYSVQCFTRALPHVMLWWESTQPRAKLSFLGSRFDVLENLDRRSKRRRVWICHQKIVHYDMFLMCFRLKFSEQG
ncbi:hypothetical protein Bca101_098902 [Brassica carinata]